MSGWPGETQNELPCVWVSAGVLSYRLCDRQFECEGCPLYEALRGGGATGAAGLTAGLAEPSPEQPARSEDPVGRYLAQLGAGCTLHLDRAYSGEGLWLEHEPGGTLRLGMDDYTLRVLQPVDGVVLPRAGVWLQHGAPCAWVNRGRLAIALRCPLAGEVIELHPHPALGLPGSGERAEQWWFRLKAHESVGMAAGLYRNEALLTWFVARVRAVRDQLNGVMTPSAGGIAGPALADGGIPTLDLEMVLGRERFEALVGTLFPQP